MLDQQDWVGRKACDDDDPLFFMVANISRAKEDHPVEERQPNG